ncbi:MAG: hypothetical protein KF851_00510 [Pirellulaceae bacterium]|nr:hypothetical protein [Pirellulaceae bacterium]
MAPYILTFLDELKTRGYDVSEWSYEVGENSTLRLAAKNSLVGPLVLFDDREELTLEFGTKYHCHFDGQETDEYGTDRMHAASMLAADYVDRILREQIGVAVHYNDRGCIGAALIYLDEHGLTPDNLKYSNIGVYGGLIRTERFLWSGPVPNPT